MVKRRAKAQNDSHADEPERKEVRLRYVLTPEVKPVFANQMIVQSDEHTTFLSFFQLQPPVMIGESPEEVRKQIDALSEVPANMVAQVIIPTDRMKVFIAAMSSTIERNPQLRAVLKSGIESSAHSITHDTQSRQH